MKKLSILVVLLASVSCFGQQVDINTGTKGILATSRGGTGVNSIVPFVQTGVDVNTSFQVTALHLTSPVVCTGGQFATGINSSGNAVCSTPAGGGNVSTTGSPVSGNLAKFSAATTITNGDLSGDVTTAGTLATTLATVNAGPGACGDSTHVCQVTTNGKGLVTSQSAVAISSSGGTVTSVGLALPASLFTVSGTPVTTTGTLTGAFASISAHRYLGNNTTGSATAALVQPNTLDLSDFPSQTGQGGKFLTTDGVSTLSWALPAAFQVNGVPLISQSTVNIQNSASFHGLVFSVSNGSAGNIQLGASGTLANDGLQNNSITYAGTTCSLGNTCYPTNSVQLSQTAAISPVTLATPSGNAMYRVAAALNCDSSSAAATVNITVSWTDPSSTVQTSSLGSAIDCTTLGAASRGSLSVNFRAKSGAAITYSTAIASTPTYDVSVTLERLTSN